jgi:hypothetical protein
MKKIVLFIIINSLLTINLHSGEHDKKIKLKTDSKLTNFFKNKKNNGELKLKTESKITDIVSGKEKVKIPNPLTALKKLGKAIKPSILEK